MRNCGLLIKENIPFFPKFANNPKYINDRMNNCSRNLITTNLNLKEIESHCVKNYFVSLIYERSSNVVVAVAILTFMRLQ